MSFILVTIFLIFLNSCTAVTAGGALALIGVASLQEKTAGHIADDATIMIKINNDLLKYKLFSSVSVQVTEGRVMLTGSVSLESQKSLAESITWNVEGVKEVINEIQITGNKKTFAEFATDARLRAQIGSSLISARGVRSLNYGCRVERGNVYISGIARSEEELALVMQKIRSIHGVKKVVSYIRMHNSKLRG